MTPLDNVKPEVPVIAEALARLCDVLWQERDLLTSLRFRLESQLSLLRSKETQWLRLADDDVRAAVRVLHDCEVLRALEMQVVVEALGLPPDATLSELAAVSPEPWAAMLHDHHWALTATARGARHAVARTRELIGGDPVSRACSNSISCGDDDG